MVEKFGRSDGLEGGEFGLETGGWGNGLCGGLNARLGSKKGPSSALAGDGDRLPGIGSKPDPLIKGLD